MPKQKKKKKRFILFLFKVSFLHQTSGDVLSLGLEIFLENSRMKLIPIGLNRLDLKIESVHENDSGLYTCFINDDELSSFSLQVLSKSFSLQVKLT